MGYSLLLTPKCTKCEEEQKGKLRRDSILKGK